MPPEGITFTGVRVLAGERQLLEVPDLHLTEQRISVIGPNGGGKSTLLQLMNSLIEPSYGHVSVNGLDTIDAGSDVRQQVGFVFANPAAQLVMPTPLEDVELSLRGRIKNSRERRAAVRDCLEQLGIADLAERSSHEISAGQQQLVALATVVVLKPRLLLLDEPTTLLDRVNAGRFMHTVEQMCTAQQIQIVTATHDLQLAARAQRCLMIEDGAISLDGAPAEVITEYIRRTDHASLPA